MIKLFHFKTALTVFILTLSTISLLAEDAGNKPVLELKDSSPNFTVLKNLFDSGFFKENKYQVQYIPMDAGLPDKNIADNFFLTSELQIKDDIENASFKFYLIDPAKQNVMLNWDIPGDDSHQQKISVRNMTNFAFNACTSGVQDAIVNTSGFSNEIEKVEVNYSDSNESEVSGYNLSVRTGFSSTHRFIRTLSELTLMTGIGMANYWINKDANMEDWRYKYRWEDVGRRFRDGWSWDSNAFRTNTIYHIYAGSIYYQTARSNDYGILASAIWSFAGSSIWEYIGEWREQTSGNDMIFTPLGGSLVGEAFHQSSIYVEQCMPNSVYGRIFSFLLDPMRIINRALDGAFDGHYNVNIVFVNPAVQAVIDKANNN